MEQSKGGQMSDTPRTDQMEQHAYWFDDDMTPVCESRFVRPLEMELIAAQQRIKRLEEAGDVLAQRSAQLGLLPMAIEGWDKAKEAK
jgi:hypothetical protein